MAYYLTSDEMDQMMIEVAQGLTPEQSSLAPLTDRQQLFWDQYGKELIAAQAARIILDVSQELPNLSTYRKGYATTP